MSFKSGKSIFRLYRRNVTLFSTHIQVCIILVRYFVKWWPSMLTMSTRRSHFIVWPNVSFFIKWHPHVYCAHCTMYSYILWNETSSGHSLIGQMDIYHTLGTDAHFVATVTTLFRREHLFRFITLNYGKYNLITKTEKTTLEKNLLSMFLKIHK